MDALIDIKSVFNVITKDAKTTKGRLQIYWLSGRAMTWERYTASVGYQGIKTRRNYSPNQLLVTTTT